MTATHPEIMQAAGNFHDHIRNTRGGQPQDIFDHPTPFDTGNHVFHDNADAGNQVIEKRVANTQLLASGLFFGCWVRTLAGS